MAPFTAPLDLHAIDAKVDARRACLIGIPRYDYIFRIEANPDSCAAVDGLSPITVARVESRNVRRPVRRDRD